MMRILSGARRVHGALGRRLRAARLALADRFRPSFGATPEHPVFPAFPPAVFDRLLDRGAALEAEVEPLLRHRFTVFGRRELDLGFGAAAPGRDGHHWPATAPVEADAGGMWLGAHVCRANRARSAAIWALITTGPQALPDYRPIDWQRDPVSGFRWNGRHRSRRLAIAPARGVDIKAAWQTARLQHLPRLAIAAARAGRRGEHPRANRIAAEIRAQALDFLAANPPRHGVQWRSVMEVAIRGANLALALALLAHAGLAPERAALGVLGAGIAAHRRHVLDNLEWSETARGNHYLSDLFGLAFMARVMPPGTGRDALCAFIAAEIDTETLRQFHADGGSFEGSTGYHRLAAEAVLWGLAALAGAWRADSSWARQVPAGGIRPRPGMPRGPLGSAHAPVSQAALRRLRAATAFAAQLRGDDGAAILIGDDDSGRPLDLDPADGTATPPDPRRREGLLALGEALLSPCDPDGMEGPLARLLAAGPLPSGEVPAAARTQFGETGLAEAEAPLRDLPPERRRRRSFALPHADETWRIAVFPDFGVALARRGGAHVAFRCFDPGRLGESGHSHDDNLAVDLVLGPVVIRDPGSRCYTPFPDLRRQYQAADAHDAPRPAGHAATRPGATLFHLDHLATGRLLHASEAGFAGDLVGPGWHVRRIIRLLPTGVTIEDACLTGPLAPAMPAPPACRGYDEPLPNPADPH
jgi:hypothetical protein